MYLATRKITKISVKLVVKKINSPDTSVLNTVSISLHDVVSCIEKSPETRSLKVESREQPALGICSENFATIIHERTFQKTNGKQKMLDSLFPLSNLLEKIGALKSKGLGSHSLIASDSIQTESSFVFFNPPSDSLSDKHTKLRIPEINHPIQSSESFIAMQHTK